MRCVVGSDLHINKWREFSKIDKKTGLNTRLLDGVDVLRQIREYMVENEIIGFLFLGDLFERGSLLAPDLLEVTIDELRKFKEENLKCYFLAGNHDAAKIGGLRNALRPLKDYVVVIDKPYAFSPVQGFNIIACPSRRTMEEQYGVIDLCKHFYVEGSKNIFLGHFYLDVLVDESGMNSELMECVEWDKLPENIKKCDYVFLGDYHVPVEMNIDGTVVESIGSLMHLNWNDASRGIGSFMDIDFKTGKSLYVTVDAPVFVDLEDGYSVSSLDRKDFYRITVKSKKEADEIMKDFGEGWNIKFKYDIDVTDVKSNRLDVLHISDPLEIIGKYVEHNVENKSLRKKLISFGKEAYKVRK